MVKIIFQINFFFIFYFYLVNDECDSSFYPIDMNSSKCELQCSSEQLHCIHCNTSFSTKVCFNKN